SLACFTLGTGVGGGLIVAGNLWVGANGAAAAFGHIAIDPNGPQCRCGQRGCVETYASATSLASRYGRGSAVEAFAAAERGDIAAIEAIDWSCARRGSRTCASTYRRCVAMPAGLAPRYGVRVGSSR